MVPSTQDFVDDVAVVGQDDEPFAGFVESSDRKNALRMTHKIHNVVLLPFLIGGAHNPHRFVQQDVDRLLFRRRDEAPIHLHHIPIHNLSSQFRDLPVDGDALLLDQLVRLTT